MTGPAPWPAPIRESEPPAWVAERFHGFVAARVNRVDSGLITWHFAGLMANLLRADRRADDRF
jgi:hypothetical protein